MLPANYLTELENWRAERDAAIRAENSWLALAGLCWLDEGDNLLGASPHADVQLPPGSAPASLGTLTLQGGRVSLRVSDGQAVSVDGAPVQSADLRLDVSGNPSRVTVGSLVMIAIQRGARYAMRVWDNSRPERQAFPPRQWYPPDAAYRVTARIVLYDPPKPIIVPDILGSADESGADARLEFALGGTDCALDMFALDDGRFYMLFKDATSGQATYPTGRYIYTEPRQGDTVLLDFNRAYNPPCAFTAYATCPIAPRENHLPIAVPAGELYPHHHA
jgi:uncharacterized protein (DUF1684 family)